MNIIEYLESEREYYLESYANTSDYDIEQQRLIEVRLLNRLIEEIKKL